MVNVLRLVNVTVKSRFRGFKNVAMNQDKIKVSVLLFYDWWIMEDRLFKCDSRNYFLSRGGMYYGE